MFRRLFALWSLLSLLLASGPVFAGWTSAALSTPAAAERQAFPFAQEPATWVASEGEATQPLPSSPSSQSTDAESSPDPMDWPEGIELSLSAPAWAVLPQAVMPHVGFDLPDPCLGALQRPPCSLS